LRVHGARAATARGGARVVGPGKHFCRI
jgi:hypothetical protein